MTGGRHGGLGLVALVAALLVGATAGPATALAVASESTARPVLSSSGLIGGLRRLGTLSAPTSGPRASVVSVSGSGWASELDPAEDVDRRADVTNVSARMQAGRVRVALAVPTTPDIGTDRSWQLGASFVAWRFDVNHDGNVDAVAAVFARPGGRFASSVTTPDGTHVLCNANASYVPARRTLSATIPLGCLGNPSGVVVQGISEYDPTPDDGPAGAVTDLAPDDHGLDVTGASVAPGLGGGVTADGAGTPHPFAAVGSAPSVSPSDRIPFGLARGLTVNPDGGTGYVVDGFGGLHPFGTGRNAGASATAGGPYWAGWDIARGVAADSSGRGGFVLDGFGGLHPFGVGQPRALRRVVGAPYWAGWDIARGVAVLPDGRGGVVLDSFGGLHWFGLGAALPTPTVFGAPYWLGRDRARGVAIAPDGSAGYIIDEIGAVHPFGIGAPTTLPLLNAHVPSPRGLGLFPTPLSLPPDAAPSLIPITGQMEDVVVDRAGTYAYATNTAQNLVEVILVPAKVVVATIPVGSSPRGLDLSPDGSTLYVANSGGSNISVIDVASRAESRRITIPANPLNDHPYWVAVGSDGTLFVTTTFGGSGYGGRMMWVDPTDDQITPLGVTTERSHVAASGDRSKILMTTADDSLAPTYIFTVATKQLSPPKYLNGYVQYVALDADGSVGLVSPGVSVLDGQLNLLGTIPAGTGGVAINRSGTIGYSVHGTTIDILGTAHFTTLGTIAISDDAGGAFGVGANVALTADDATLVVTTLHGVVVAHT